MENNTHPIGELMNVTMQKIRDMVDVNTIVGNPITTPDGTTVIPVSKVSFGFASGGSDFAAKGDNKAPLFGGGSGAGVTIAPLSFLVIHNGNVKMLPVSAPAGNTADKIVELVPEMFDKISALFSKEKKNSEIIDIE